jgi:hypothetical protein
LPHALVYFKQKIESIFCNGSIFYALRHFTYIPNKSIFVQWEVNEGAMIVKTRSTIKVASSVSKQIISLLCALLFTGCMGEDFFTPDKHRPPGYRVKVEEKFRQKSVYSPRQHEQYLVSRIPDYLIRGNADDGQRSQSSADRVYDYLIRGNTDDGQHSQSGADRVYDYLIRGNTDDGQHSQSGVDRVYDYLIRSNTDDGQHSQSGVDRVYGYLIRGNTDDGQRGQSGVGTKSLRSALTTQTIRKERSEMPTDVFEDGCVICCDKDAYKIREAVQCTHCENFVCQRCYEQVHKASITPIVFDYFTPMSTGNYRLEKSCPFCRRTF